MTPLRKFLTILSPRECYLGLVMLVLVCMMAVLEVFSVAATIPLLSVIGDPEATQTNAWVTPVYNWMGQPDRETFLRNLLLWAIALTVFSSVFRVFAIYLINRYVHMRRHSISEKLLSSYMRRPYVSFLNLHSNDMAKNILSETDQLVQHFMRPLLDIVAQSVLVMLLLSLLFFYDASLASRVLLVIFGLYCASYLVFRGRLHSLGVRRMEANTERFTAAGDALTGIKDIKLLGRESAYLDRFRPPSVVFSQNQASKETIGLAPRYLFEALGISGMLGLAYVQVRSGAEIGEVLPTIGLFAITGAKLLPSVQKIYQSTTLLRFSTPVVDVVHKELSRVRALPALSAGLVQPLVPRRGIRLENVGFRYPGATQPGLLDIDIDIPIGSSLGIVGKTGAGKTTLVDIVLGLLDPSEGHLKVDGQVIDDTSRRAWQKSLGYVPQHIFLADASLAQNIALGIPPEDIDRAAVERAAKIAQLDAVIQDLPNGYDTVIGERGTRLSGGQRQRIGIGRALYHDPAVVVFDEATSALDNETESAVMEALSALAKVKTLILIAHRLNTVAFCDAVISLEAGRIVEHRS